MNQEMNQCFFCGPTENRITEEHVWPLWVSELLRGKYGSDHVITFNRRHFEPAAAPFGLEILAPADAVRRLENRPWRNNGGGGKVEVVSSVALKLPCQP